MASSTTNNNSTTDLMSVEQWATQCVSSWTRVDKTGDTMRRRLAWRFMKDCLGQLQAIADDAETEKAHGAYRDEANRGANGDEETPVCSEQTTQPTPLTVWYKNTKRICCSRLYAEMFKLPFLEHIRFTGPIRIDGTCEHKFPRVNTVEMVWNNRYTYDEYEAMCAADGKSTGLLLFPALKHLTITVNDCGGPADAPYRDTRVAVHIVEAMQICNCRPDTLVIRRARNFTARLDPIRNHCERNNIAWTETVA